MSRAYPRHDGQPALADAELLVAPDPAIGEVRSVQTSCRRGGSYPAEHAVRERMREVGGLMLLAAGAATAFAVHAPSPHALLPWATGLAPAAKAAVYGVSALAAVIGALATWLLRPRRTSYVGVLGVQTYVKVPGLPARRRVFRFAEAARLRSLTTRRHLNGRYRNTRYEYAWFDARERRVFRLVGIWNDQRAPAIGDPVLLGTAAVAAWRAWERAGAARR